MPVSAEIFSVDTLAVRPAEEAFSSGELLMRTFPSEAAAASCQWIDFPLNWLLLLSCILACVFFLNRIIGIFPFITGSLFRWKEIVNLENSIKLTRDRNSIAFIALFIIVLAVSRFDIYSPSYLSLLPRSLHTAGILGAVLLFLLLREIFIIGLSPRSFSIEQYRLANRSIFNFMIFWAAVIVFTVFVRMIFNINLMIIKNLILIQIGFFYFIFLIRKTQIMIKACGHIAAFLYLCSLELLPAGLLIASGLFL